MFKNNSHFSNVHVFSTVLYLFSLNKNHSVYKGWAIQDTVYYLFLSLMPTKPVVNSFDLILVSDSNYKICYISKQKSLQSVCFQNIKINFFVYAPQSVACIWMRCFAINLSARRQTCFLRSRSNRTPSLKTTYSNIKALQFLYST